MAAPKAVPIVPGVPQARATTYQLTVVNNSAAFEQFAVYQNDPDLGVTNVMSLAWFTKPAHPGTTTVFDWTEDYSLMLFKPGSTNPIQTLAVDPADPTKQQVQIGYTNGALGFQAGPVVADPKPGNIYVRELSGLPDSNVGDIGLAIGGKPAYAVSAAPNLDVVFTPKAGTNYWLTAGNHEAGAVLDAEEITAPVEISFAPGVFALTATLNKDNTWTVSPTGVSS